MLEKSFDDRVRWQIYDTTMNEGAPPLAARVADLLGSDVEKVHSAFDRLAKRRMIILQPGGDEILMAGPFSAVPTPFRVSVNGYTAYGNCVWDALGIPATLHSDAVVDTSCGDCGAAARFEVKDNVVIGEGFMHFALPARTWWDDIVFT